MNRDDWIRWLYSIICTFASRERQNTDWFLGGGNRQSSFKEDYSILFDYLRIDEYLDSQNKYQLDANLIMELSEFIKRLASLPITGITSEFLKNDRRWNDIVEISQRIMQQIEIGYASILDKPIGSETVSEKA